MTESETMDRFARQIAQILTRLEAEGIQSDVKEGNALCRIRAGQPGRAGGGLLAAGTGAPDPELGG